MPELLSRDKPIPEKLLTTTANLIRRMLVGSIITEYALLEMKDNTQQDLKMRVNTVLRSIKSVQDFFTNHPQSGETYRNIFKLEFNQGKFALMGELIEIACMLDEDGVEELINQLKAVINGTNNVEHPNDASVTG